MPKIDQLPSGTYRARIYSHTDDQGKKHYKSITGSTKKEVKLKIAEFQLDKKEETAPNETKTVRQAIEAYIESKSFLSSPSTIRSYTSILNNRLQSIMDIPLSDLTLLDIQTAINAEGEKHSPKTVRNINALLKGSIKLSAPNFAYKVTLPQKIKPDINIPSENEMLQIFRAVKGKRLEVPIYLAALCGMRRSEIVALKWKDVNLEKGILTIRAASVIDKDGKVIRRDMTKTTASKRTIRIFAPALAVLKSKEHTSEFVEYYPHPNRIQDSFSELLKRLGLPHYRFHDLRHYAVSSMLMRNIPRKYISGYVGHENERMVELVYSHIMADKKEDFLNSMDGYYSEIFSDI